MPSSARQAGSGTAAGGEEGLFVNIQRTTVYRIDRFGLWWIRFTDEEARRMVNTTVKDAQAEAERLGLDES
jgi:hypothetical protein